MGGRLIEAHEEERTWIARELHDDINQRIAFLAVQLGDWARHLPNSGNAINVFIHQVRADLANLGNDIQALSHRLHSSKLEYLGVAAEPKGCCRGFSNHKHAAMEFTKEGSPRSL